MRSALTVGFVLVGLAGRATAADGPSLPQPAEGWKITLAVEAPRILFPTAIVAAPDGTLYLGQDPMDMPGPATEPIDSIVSIKNGKVQVFADGLWSVMGLEWVDGTLIVVHAPYLSAFRDTNGDGKADSRVDLMTGLGPKLPGFNGINDHIASGIRLGMDGFLYISVGDKGIYKGVGKDGTTIQLYGGGVIRIRPDGSGLEVVSSGERNPMSVALSTADDIFTYGNDDDSKKWPNSLTHHIIGGHYGYPYQFLLAPSRTLPVVFGQIGGSGTQGICYNDDGLPAAYRGNLFFCDWGLSTVFRFELERQGGTFVLKRRSAFVTAGALEDFRPFSLAVAADGNSLWLVDWAYNNWLASGPQTGRLYHLTYEGADRVRPAPRPTTADAKARLAALDHPALSVRIESQRQLAALGASEVGPLTARLSRKELAAGRVHALWALDAIGTPEARTAIRAAVGDGDASVRVQAVRSAGIRADRAALRALTARLVDDDPAVRREAAIALGKLGDPVAGSALMAALGDRDAFVAWSVRQAIRRLGAWDESALVSALGDAKRRDDALKLTDEAWALPVVRALVTAVPRTEPAEVRARVVRTLAGLYRQYPVWTGEWFGTNPLVGRLPKKTRDWDATAMAAVLQGLTRGLGDRDPGVRLQAIVGLRDAGPAAAPVLRSKLQAETDPRNAAELALALGILGDSLSAPPLIAVVQDAKQPTAVRAAALDGLSMLGGPQVLRARFALIYDPKAPAMLVARALPALGRDGVLPANDLAGFLSNPAAEVRQAALLAFNPKRPLPEDVKTAVIDRLTDSERNVRRTAIDVVAALKIRAAIPRLITLANDEADRDQAIHALATMPDPQALPLYLAAIQDHNPDLRRDGESALVAIRDSVAADLNKHVRSGRLNPPAVGALERVLSRFTPIVDWRVIGPFPRTTAKIFMGESSIDFARTQIGAAGRTVAWTPRMANADGRLVLDDLKAGAGDRGGFGYDTNGTPNLGAFAYAEIVSDRDRPALLLIGSSGTVTVTVNERWVLNERALAGRPFQADSDRVRVDLKKGTNRVLVQSRQGIGTWSISVQVSEPGSTLIVEGPATDPVKKMRTFALNHAGDPKKGETLFFDPKGIGCVKCHAVEGRGTGTVGPDLAGLALKYDRAEIIRSVLDPSDRVATGYQPVLLALADGKVVTGLVRSESDSEIELVDADAHTTRVPKAEIAERSVSTVSVMPKGLVETLTPVEFTDLVTYLQSLKTAPSVKP